MVVVVVVCREEGLVEVKGRRGLHVCDLCARNLVLHKTSFFGACAGTK